MKKVKKFKYYIIIIIAIFVNFSIVNAEKKKLLKNIPIFNNEIYLETKLSFNSKNQIDWSNQFELQEIDNKKKIFKLENKNFKILRHVIYNHKNVTIEDHYTNKTNKTIGIISKYKIKDKNLKKITVSGHETKDKFKIIAENPTILINSKKLSYGIYIKDLFSKIYTNVNITSNNEFELNNDNLILKPNKKYVKILEIDIFDKKFKYYDYINFLRTKFNVFKNIEGNFFFIDSYRNLKSINNTKFFDLFVKKYNVKYILLTPWLDYSNYDFENKKKFNRKEFKNLFLKLKNKTKILNPEVKFIAALQSNVVSLKPKIQNKIKDNNKNIKDGFNHYKIDKNYLIKNLDFKIDENELIFNKKNEILFETFYHDNKYGSQKLLEIALALKATSNGYLKNKLKEQIDFVIDELSFDGVYIDQFNQHFISPNHRISFNSKNVNIGKIDFKSGQVYEESENITLNTLDFKKEVLGYALKKTDYIFLNTHHLHDEFRKLPITRFGEGFWDFWVSKLWEEKNKTFYDATSYFSSHLSTPVALSMGTLQQGNWQNSPHKALVKNFRFSLYNGNLMYFLEQDIEKLELYSERLNIFQKIFPIKIEEINKGIIIGQNKIISIKNFNLLVEEFKNYNLFVFNSNGFLKKSFSENISYHGNYVKLKIDELNEVLILEKK